MVEFREGEEKMKLTPQQIEEMAKEIRRFLIENNLWQDVAIYFNGKCFTTSHDGIYAYNDPNNLIVLEDKDPKEVTKYAGDILTMTFEGPLYDCINGTGEYNYTYEREKELALSRIFDKYGCYCELGEAWNLTLYQISRGD